MKKFVEVILNVRKTIYIFVQNTSEQENLNQYAI